jgi:hypothetical protein
MRKVRGDWSERAEQAEGEIGWGMAWWGEEVDGRGLVHVGVRVSIERLGRGWVVVVVVK